HLAKCNPPLVVSDLFEDVKDGVMLLALLEVLSGHKLPCEQGRKLRRIHWVANVGRALKFLEGRRSAYRGSPIKLVNINTTDVVDGRPSIVLGLIWTIILYFQIEELTSHLPALQPQSSSNSSVESSNSTETSSPPVKRKPRLSFQGGAKRALLKWVQTTATKRLGLDVKDFGPSWRTGVAFHAVIFALRPHLVNMERVWRRPNRDNLEDAFSLAERELGIPQLLDPEDVDVDKPDEKSIMTYVAQFLKHHPDSQETEIGQHQEEREQRKTLRELRAWADQLERDCAQGQRNGGSPVAQYQTFKHYSVQFEVQRRQVEKCIQSSQKDGKLTADQALVKQAWERLSARLLDWHLQLDSGLPHPLGQVGVWLHQAEKILREELVPQQVHDEPAKAIHKKLLERHKQTLQLIHRDRCVNNVPIPMEQLQDMAERLNYISTSSHVHLSKLEFWESKYSMLAFLTLTESKLKSWIIKYDRLESMELLLQSYGDFVEGQQFFEKYESSHQALINAAELYIKTDSSVEGGVKLFLREVSDQWRSLSVEVRSVRSMLEEVQCNWLRYNSCVASLQAWLEDAQGALRQPENTKREFFRNLAHWMDQHAAMNDAGNFLIETCDETVTCDIKHQLLLLNGRWRELFLMVKPYARLPETHKVRMQQDVSLDIQEFLDTSISKLSSPLQVSLLDVKDFMQDVEDIKHRLPGLEAQYKAAPRSAQLLAKDSVHGSGTKALSSVTATEAQLHQVCAMFAQYYALMQEALEWRQVAETNGSLMRRYEESRADLEKALRVGQACLKERGDPDELFRKHNEFFGRLDQHILSAYLKACDDLTDIISEEDQQSLRETDIQAEAPSHLLRLRVETERRLVMTILQECWAELKREDKALLIDGSEKIIKEHRAFFKQKNPLSVCEKRLKTMEHLCQDLPENDKGYQMLEETRDHLSEVRGLVERTYLRLQQDPDKWIEWHLTSLFLPLQTVKAQGESLDWLKARLAVLEDISPESEGHTQRAALDKLSQQFSALLLSLSEVKDPFHVFMFAHAHLVLEAIWQFVCLVSPVLQRELIFSSLDNLKIEMKNVKVRTQTENIGNMFAVRAESLVKKAGDIKLGPQNQSLLQDQAQSTKERLQEIQANLEMMHRWWQGFSHESEAFFSWVGESKKELEAFSRTSMLKKGLEEKMDVFSRVETELQILIHFITPNEAGRIKARLTQIGRYREEFKNSVEQQEAELHSSFLNGLQEKLNVPVTSCTSASTTYKTLHEHMVSITYVWEQKAVADLQQAHKLHTQQATEKQSKLENLLTLWQRHVFKYLSLLQSWLNRCESLCSSDSPYLTADNVKLHSQIQMLQEDKISLQTQGKSLEALQPHLDALSPSLASKDLQHLQTRKEDCLQLFSEAQSLVAHRDEALLKLKDFCETYNKARTTLQTFQDAVEGRGSWDDSKVREINQELGDLAKELACLEVQAISLDIILNKAHFHLQGSEEERTSCRGLVDDVVLSVQVLQRSIGTKQSEAEALAAMWSSFRGWKELLLGSLAKLEDRVNIPWPTEASTHAFQQRLWLLKQLEEEIQALQHSQLWLGERGEQLAHKDSELAGDAQRDVALVQSTWERTRAIIVEEEQKNTLPVMAIGKYSTCSCSFEVMAADLRKRISHAAEVYEQTKGMYKDFNSQRQQLLELISQISEQLKTSEDSLSEFSTSSDPENFVKIKVSEVTEFYLNIEAEFYYLSNWLQQLEARLKTDAPLWGESHWLYLFFHRASLERLCQSSLTITERESTSENSVAAELLSNHEALLQEARSRLRNLQEYQAFEEALKAVETWLKDVERNLEKLENMEGNKKEVEEKLDSCNLCLFPLIQDILLMKGEGEVKLNMAAGKAEMVVRDSGEVERGVICSKLQEIEDAWAALLLSAMSCHSRLEWTVNQWDLFVESRAQLQRWLEGVGLEVKGPLEPQLGLREKRKQLERLRLLSSDVEDHQGALCYLEESAAELYKRTGDPVFKEDEMVLLRAQFEDVKERVRLSEDVVLEHKKYMETNRELTDWLMVVGEELQQHSDPSGDPPVLNQKLTKVRELLERGACEGRERLRRVRLSAERAGRHTAAAGCELMDGEVAALARALHQWEGASLRARDALETAVAAATGAEREQTRLTAQLEEEMQKLGGQLKEWSEGLSSAERRNSGAAAVEGWTVAKGVLEGLQTAEVMEEKLKAQLNELCGFSSDLGPQSDRVSALIKLHNSLSLRASRECQNKEKLLEQRFRSSLHDFRQWMVNANISTAKCFDSPHSIREASIALQRIQEFRSDKEQGQTRLNTVLTCGKQLSSVVPADRVEAIRTKANAAKDDWKSLMDSLQRRETALQVLQSQMQDFEASVEPLQDWLNRTEISVQESSARLHDLPAKRLELSKLQTLLEEMRSRESELAELRGRAHGLWEGQGAGKSFVHRVCQLAACYLALSNLIKEKVSRVERVVGEHQLFSKGLQELQNWVSESQQVLKTCRCPTSDKSVLITRMGQLETLLAACQGREIQLKMLITRGESVQRNTSAEGVPVVRKQIQDLKDSWESLLSTSIQCKSQLEGALSHWTSYQEDVSQFECWMEQVEESLGNTDKHYAEMRDKTANLGRAKLLYEEVLSHSSPLETIATKGSNVTEHTATQWEIQKLSERYTAIKVKAKAAVSKAEELVLLHQEYQRGLHMFEDWLEQEQNSLTLLKPLDVDVNALENTLKELQMLQSHCPKGHNLLSSVLAIRERVIPWGPPQIEDRALETAQTEWQGYQDRLGETKVQVEQALARVQQLEGLFQSLDQWLVDMELKVKVRSHRCSDVTAKEAQLQHLKIEAAQRQAEVEGLSTLAQQVVEDAHVSGRISTRVTQLTARYHSLLLQIQAKEMQKITEAQNALRTFSDWLSTARKNFKIVTERTEALDRITMEKKMKRLESLQGDMDQGHSMLKTLRENAEQAVSFLDDPGASRLEKEVRTGRSQLEELILGLREEHATLERSLVLYKDFQERYKSQMQWLKETRALLSSTVEPKVELYQRKAQLNKYKAVEQTLLSRDSAVSFVLEKGETLVTLLHSPSITDNMIRLQADYQELCGSARTHVHRLEAQVKKQEAYHKDVQEIERWLLQMSSKMVTPDPSSGGGLEAATQQLARHKAIMEEIAGFEERLDTLKEKGEELLSGCSERLQARLRQQIQNHQQGARDSYSAICSTAQHVYQSLDRELQKRVSLRDTLQQCQTWLSNVQEEIQIPPHAPHCLQEVLAQMKQDRTLQEQASTYLQLVCSTCDLSDEKVRETAAEIQQVKLQIEERMLESQELADNWREIKDLRSNLECRLLEAEQLLQSMLRRPAELEPKVAQNQLDQAQDFIQEMRARQVDLTQLRESINRLTAGQESPELMEVGRLRCAWLDLGREAAQLLEQKEEDLQRSGDYHDCICMVEELFDQLSKKWDQLARGDIESTSECLDALKKLSTDLQDQRCVLDDLRNNRHGILPRLSLEERDLVKEQVGYLEQRWTQVESLVQQKIQDSVQTLEELSQIEDNLHESQEWAELQKPSLSEVLKTSPPPDLAQSFLFDHLSFCAELEAKQKLLAEAVKDANSLSSRLGLNERRMLQTLVQEAQTEVESLGTKAVQYRKSLRKVFTERTQFLQALDRAAEWIRKQEQRALADDHVALLPNVLHKQVSTCKNFTSSLRAYQVELTSLWVQGRGLVKDATDEEKKETLQKLEELQVTFEASLQKSTEHLQHLEKALVIRKYFKVDLDRICEWLKQAEVATFPIIDLSGNDEELQNQLTGYQQLLDHASEYENLLLIVQRAGQEILPNLNEVDHCYLDEKLNGLPQQYNDMLLLIREKRDRIQQVLLDRREFESLIDVTRKALKELQEKCDGLEKSPNQSLEDGERLHSSYEDLMKGLANLFQGMKDLRGKTQDFLVMGQPYAPEVIDQLVYVHGSLYQQIECKMKEIRRTLKLLNDHRTVIEKMDYSISRLKGQLDKLDSKGDEKTDALERLSTLHNLTKLLEEVSSYPEGLETQNDDLNRHFDSKTLKTQVIFREEQLLTLKQKINTHIEECERGFMGNKDFQTDIKVSIDWLKSLWDRLRFLLCFLTEYHHSFQTVQQWFEDTGALLKQALQDVDLEKISHCLKDLENITGREHSVKGTMRTRPKLVSACCTLYSSLYFFVRSITQWRSFQDETDEVIRQMNEVEKRMMEFTTARANSEQEAEDKLCLYQNIVSEVQGLEDALNGLKVKAAQFVQPAIKDTSSRSVCSLSHRWTRLFGVARAQVKALQDSACNWRYTREKTENTTKTIHVCWKFRAFRRNMTSMNFCLSILSLCSVLSVIQFFLKNVQPYFSVICFYIIYHLHNNNNNFVSFFSLSLLQQVCATRQQVQVELREREEVVRELGLLKGWIQDTQGLLLSPTADLDNLLTDLETLFEELEECGRALSELDVAVQEFGEQNPLLAKQLCSSLSKLTELHAQTSRLAEGRTTCLQKAEKNFEEFNEMLTLTLNWTEKAETVVSANIMWSPGFQIKEQIQHHQVVTLTLARSDHSFSEFSVARVVLLGEVVQTDALHQQVAELSRHAEELQQRAKTRLLMLQDASKDLGRLESDVKSLHQSIERVQETLASPDLARLSLREQLTRRQLLLSEMEGLKQQVQTMQMCQSALRLPEDVIAALPLCVTAQSLQQESSHLQHNTIQQCNILQEALVQYEQYEQEVKNLQRLIEEAHRVIQDRPVATGNIQELQTQIQHHEELALKIKGYQEQISALNSKCKMLTVKAKHATMLLTVSEVDGLSDGLEELEDEEEEMPKHPPAHSSVVMMTAGRCHTLLSPVTEESGEEGTNSEVSSPPACRSPSPGPNFKINQSLSYSSHCSVLDLDTNIRRAPLSRAPLQELYDPSMESAASANLDDLQRSWETLKNVISEKQKSLYEALERQHYYQETLQSVSTKMESIETALNEGLEPSKSPESQMAAHQALMDEILMLQDEISALQACFSRELQLDEDSLEADSGDQLALQSTLTVLGERMATIHMKASGKRQLLEERLSEQLEEQRQEQALQRYHSEAEELDNWLFSTRATLSSTLQPHPQDMDMEEQLIDCQNMLLEIEQKVLCLSELSVHSESLLMEGKAGTRGDAEQLSLKLHSLKSSLLELQRILQDKQTHIQGSLQEQEDTESDSSLSQSPNMMDWLSQARSTRNQQHQDTVQRQRQLGEQKKLLQSVASRGEEIISQRTTPNGERFPAELSEGDDGQWPENMSTNDQMRVRWENLSKDLNNKLQLSLNTMEQTPCNMVHNQLQHYSLDLFADCHFFMSSPQTGGADSKRAHALKRALYEAVSSASSWLDNAENDLVSGPVLLSDDSETHLGHLESLNKEVKNVNEEVCKCRDVLGGTDQLWVGESGESVMVEEVLDGLEGRLKLLDTVLEQRCDTMKDKLQELSVFQVQLLLTAVSDSKYQLLQKMNAVMDRPASKQMEILAEAEDSLREFEQKVSEMRSRGETLLPNQLCTQDLLKLQDVYEELVEMVGSKRSELNQSLVLKAQYERALQDLVELLDTAQDKMAADQKMKVGSVIEVQILLDKHKEFFQGLETHVVLTQAFFRQVSGLVVQREVQSLEETVAQAQAVLKQAHKRGVELEGILEWWSRLVGDYQALYRQLEAVESSIPSVGLVEETEDRLNDRITLYQRLKASLSERQQQLYKLLEDGKRLLLHVSCSELETQLTQLGEHWLSTTTKINKELHRLDSTLKHWIRYQSESAELSQWLSSALDRLEFWSTQSVTVPQELETVRDHLHAFLEFSKEVDAKSSLRASVQSQGNQLLRLKKVDTAALRAKLAQVDTQWADLLTRIPVVQEKLHQLQMEKLPSRHAITELMSWISLMENVIQEDQQKIMGAVGSEALQMYLQKYKGFRIDLSCKQLTVDFVNQSVLQISSQDVEGKRSDKTDFAERLGAMNRRWQILQGLVTEKIQDLEGLLESRLEFENVVQTLKTWFSVQEERLKKKHRIEDVSSAQNALKDCQEMEVLVKEKEKDLEKAEEKGCLLIQDKKGEAGSVIMDTLKGLNQSWANLDHMVCFTLCILVKLLQWSLYKQAYEEIQGYLMEGRYTISRLCLLTGSPEAVLVQVENLETLQDELEKQESSLRKLGSITQQLLRDSHPSVSDSLNTALGDVNLRWNMLLEQISDQLRRSKSLLQLWQHYKALHAQSNTDIQKLEDQVEQLLKSATHRDVTEQEVKVWIYQCMMGYVKSVLQQLDEFSEQLRQQVDPSAMTTFHTDHLSLTQRLATVGHALQRQHALLEAGVRNYERFSKELHSLSHWSEEAEKVLKEPDPIGSPDISSVQEHMEKLKTQMLKLSSLSPDLERLNELGYQLPLNDNEIKHLQNLNRSWSSNSAHTIERFSKLQSLVLQRQSFLEKCDAWMTFLTQIEEKLAADISGNYQSLLDQQREHELFQAEMFSRHQILYSIINDGHQLLNQGQVEERDDFGMKLALLSNQWQGVVRRAQQRRGIIDSLVRQWQRYMELIEKLHHWLQEVSVEPEQQQGATVALQQIRGMLDHIQLKERVLQRQQGSYILTVEAGRQLLLWADARTEASLHTELTDVQEHWRTINIRLDERKKELLSWLRDWDQCEKGISASHEKLRDFKQKLSVPLPDHHEELHTEQICCKELESSVEGWTDDVAGLCILRESLSSGLSADDLTVLQERLILLQRQWEETCHQLSLRRQQVSERLNEWAVFNEKNKELCEWLTQMESKVSQNGDVTIEEMIEKLRKDYQEEISVAKENKYQLEQMGERLAQASHESKAAEIQYKLSKVNERWQHLLDLIEARVKKLRETLVAVQQLDKNMSSLRSWLAHIETELSRPIVYETCDSHEIQRKLNQQQDLQRDIEKHSTGVASVLNLCEVLLHDCDACATETECESIQQATRGLDRRWRNICAVAMERRLKIEETWRLWQKFLDDYSRFEEWLKVSERTAALPNSSGVLYTVAKEELKKFEAFQRQVQECLTQLELINKQYRRLARENRTDSSCHLRQMVHDGNRRWDILQRRVAAILRRLKHFIGQREEFETARDGILVWLTEMDLQLTNIEHFSECDIQAKIKQLKAFQQEISLNMGKMESVFGQGEVLMKKSEPLDAAVIEEELDELQRYCREVFGRVERYYRRLTRLPLTDDEFEGSDREFESGDLSDLQWGEDGAMPQTSSRPPSAGTVPVLTNGSGRDTPASVDSIPLEWDHDYDLDPMGHSMSTQQGRQKDEDEELLCLATAALTDVVIPESPEAYIKLTENTLRSSSGRQKVVACVIERWELIQAQSADSDHKEREDLVLLQKMTSDLDAMEAWLSQAEAELEELRGKNLSADIHTIEQRIRKLKELQKAMDSHKSKVLSINLNSVTLLQSVSEESQDLQAKLKEMNSRWDRLGKSLKDWRTALQDALMQCQEFHELSHGLLLWLENIDRRRNEIIPIASGLDRPTLQAHYRALKQIQRELLETEQKVDSLQELSGQLLVQTHGGECLEAQERVHVIGNRLQLLLKAVATDMELLEKELQASGNRQVSLQAHSIFIHLFNDHLLPSGSGCVSSLSGSSGSQGGAAVARCQPFLLRVLRAALPLQLLLLLIVGLTCLVPMTEQDYSCAHANNFARSFHPMLRYMNGPPPV
uniref:Spectrin repeat containing, nuclear envelope 1a n=1 Tax=Cyprinus carpio TaxID=7962 RepID=A0A8C2KL13_CYPCA